MPAPATAPAPAAARSPRDLPAAALVAAGLLAYAAALVATLPARVVVPHSDAAGTVWHGALALPDGATARWDWSPAASVASGAFAADWTIDGPGTVLRGVARVRPFGGTELAAVSGRAAWSLLAAAVPGLPPCTIPLSVALARVSAAGSDGTVRSLAGSCPGPAGTARPVPRLIATFAGPTGRITSWTDRATDWATVTVAGGVVRLRVTPTGAAVFPVSAVEIAL